MQGQVLKAGYICEYNDRTYLLRLDECAISFMLPIVLS